MGRLPALTLFALLSFAAAGCEENRERPPLPTSERSQVIEQKASTSTAAPAGVSAAVSAPAAKPRRALCGGRLETEGKAVPKRPMSQRSALGAAELPADPALTGGYTWVNFWAAWCVPCREEIPRLRAWETKLAGAGKSFRVLFISLDDDERQLEKFLGEQPANGLRATYWLKEGKERDEWLASAGVAADPELPVHFLVDARGKIRCRVSGAVEDSDYADLLALL